jgi:hypothetical protein
MAASPKRPSQALHRRETLIYVLLPVAGGGLVLLAALAVTLFGVLPRRPQVSILADWLLTVLVLCPAVLCLLPVCILLMTMVFGLNRLHGKTEGLMGKAEDMSASLANKAINASETVSRKSIGLTAKLAFFDPLWRVFDRKEDNDGKPNP